MKYEVVKLATKFAVVLGGKIEKLNEELIFNQERKASSVMNILNENLEDKLQVETYPIPVEYGRKFVLVNSDGDRVLHDVKDYCHIELFNLATGKISGSMGGYIKGFLAQVSLYMLEPTLEELQDYTSFLMERRVQL